MTVGCTCYDTADTKSNELYDVNYVQVYMYRYSDCIDENASVV